jgi:hypothetical protein
MRYEYTAIPDAEVPVGVDPAFRHTGLPPHGHDLRQRGQQDRGRVAGGAGRAARLQTARAGEHDPQHPRPPTPVRAAVLRAIRRQRRAAGRGRVPALGIAAGGGYVDQYVGLCRRRLPQLAAGTAGWWLEPRPFFGGLVRERVWVFWRRVLHTCRQNTHVQTWLRLAGVTPVPAIYGPSGDVTWDEADPTYSLQAANRRAT